jgi:hypothetical protein
MFFERPFAHVTPLPLLSDASILADDLTLLFVGDGETNQYSEPRLGNQSSEDMVQDV